MKSVVIDEPGKVRLNEIAEPELKSDEVLLEIQYIGLCGTDLSTYRGLSPFVTYPIIPGHEVSGIIVSMGTKVPSTLKIGDKVTVNPYTSCGVCPACRLGRMNTCEFNQTLGVQRDGALRQYFAIPYNKILKSNKLSSQEFSLVEPLSVGYHATNRGQVTEIDTVLVIGCGMIGIGAIVASLKKTNRILFIDEDVPGGAAAFMFNKVMEEQGGYKYLDVAPRTITGKAHRPAYGSDGDYFSKPNAEEIKAVIKEMMEE